MSTRLKAAFPSSYIKELSQYRQLKGQKLQQEIRRLKAAISKWRRRLSPHRSTVTHVNSATTFVTANKKYQRKLSNMRSNSQPSPPSYDEACPKFTLFPDLPIELRMKIFEAALESRIIRWTRTNDQNVLTDPSRSLPLMLVSREAREASFLYGAYRNLTDATCPVYFSPKIDYLWFDPGWVEFGNVSVIPQIDSLEPLLPKLGEMRNIMVHPNWSGRRRHPIVLFGKVPSIQKVLVAADEKSIGFHGKVMLETVKEVKSYYAALSTQGQASETPYVAVGCVGWVGEERKRMHHGSEDNRQLVKIFEKQWEINSHMHHLREEEWQFTHNHFNRPKIVHKLRFVREKDESERKSSSSWYDNGGSEDQPKAV